MQEQKFRNLRLSFFIWVFLLLLTQISQAVPVTITVEVPPSTPENEPVCITGNHDLLSNWQGTGVKLKETGPNLYLFSADLPAHTQIEFKFTRGSFASVEKAASGLERPNRTLKTGNSKPVSHHCKIEAWADAHESNDGNQKPLITGNFKILAKVSSSLLKPQRNIIVWLPPSYNQASNRRKRYPVVYMHDGQNLFDPTTSFGGVDWGVDEAMTECIKANIIQEAIIVGIANTADRMSEYTPFPDPKHKGGNGASYVKFIVKELKPRIDKEFRTLKSRENTFIGGSSLGGLISLYAGINNPETFGGIIAISPSIWWSNGGIIKWLVDNGIENYKGKIWLDMGTREGEEAINYTRLLAKELSEKAPDFKGLHYREFPGGTHSEGAWKQRIHLPLKFFLHNR